MAGGTFQRRSHFFLGMYSKWNSISSPSYVGYMYPVSSLTSGTYWGASLKKELRQIADIALEMPSGNAIKTTLIKYKVRFEELLEETLGLLNMGLDLGLHNIWFARTHTHTLQCRSIQGSNLWMTSPTWKTSRMNGRMRPYVLWFFCFFPLLWLPWDFININSWSWSHAMVDWFSVICVLLCIAAKCK